MQYHKQRTLLDVDSTVQSYHRILSSCQGAEQEEALKTTAIIQEARGQPPVQHVQHSTQQLQSRLISL